MLCYLHIFAVRLSVSRLRPIIGLFLFLGLVPRGEATALAGLAEAANVRNFGAVGDGRADDTAAIQAALQSPHARIYVPGGTYRLNDILRIPGNKRLTLAPAAVMLRGANTTAMLLNQADGRTGNYGANANIVVEGGTWNGNSTLFPEFCTLLGFGHVSDLTIRDCNIINIPLWHGIELNATRRAVVERVSFSNCTNEALQLDAMSASFPGVFPWFGPYDDTKCRDIVIQDCRFAAVNTAIGSHSDPPVDGLVIRRCVVNGATDIAIKPVAYANWSLEDCEFNGCATVFTGSATAFVFRGNRISDSTVADFNLASGTGGIVEGNVIVHPKTGIVGAGPTVVVRDNVLSPVPVPVGPTIVGDPTGDDFFYAAESKSGASARSSDQAASDQVGVHLAFAGKTPASVALAPGDSATVAVMAMGSGPLSFQWQKDGVPLRGETGARLAIASAAALVAGSYVVVITNPAGSVTTAPIRLTVSDDPNSGAEPVVLTNASIRSTLVSSDAVISMGFGLSGAGSKRLLTRAIGPALAGLGVNSFVSDPRLEVYDAAGLRVAENDNWPPTLAAAFAAVGAFALPPGSADAAALVTLSAGPGTVHIRGTTPGGVLIELFDLLESANSRLTNFSARGPVDAATALFAGFSLSGPGSRQLLVRGVGPGLSAFGVASPLTNPRLEIYDGSGGRIALATGWASDLAAAFARAGAFALTADHKDAAVLVTLAGGMSYSVVLGSGGGIGGEGLIEIYEVP